MKKLKKLKYKDKQMMDMFFDEAEHYDGVSIGKYLVSLQWCIDFFERRGYDVQEYKDWLEKLEEKYVGRKTKCKYV